MTGLLRFLVNRFYNSESARRHDALHQREIAACHTGAVSLAGALQTRANSHAEFNDVVLVTGASRE